MNLFVCGNGFDGAHNVESKYNRFREWLIEEYYIDVSTLWGHLFTGYSTNYKGLDSYDAEAFAKLFIELIDEAELARFGWGSKHEIEWNQFEDLIGELNWKEIDMSVEDVLDDEGDLDPWKTGDNYAVIAREILESCHLLKKYFEDWIRQIDISKIESKEDIKKLFAEKEFVFLNFNYTKVLEKIYGINNVFYIHGEVDNYRDLVVGHSGVDNPYFHDHEEYIMMDAYDSLRGCHKEMEKHSKQIINDNESFFDSLSCVDNIYFYGFGFGDADLCYVKKIINSCKMIENIYVSDFQYENCKKDIEKALKLCGYRKEVLNMKC